MIDLVGHPPSYARVSWAIMTSGSGANLPGNIHGGEARHVASAYFVFVAIDVDGKPRQVPPLTPTSAEEERRMREAEAVSAGLRLAKKQEIDHGRMSG
jgi:hypothetical protein